MIKVEKDNVVLSVEDKDLAQYEARGFKKIEEVEKVASSKAEKAEKKVK